METGRRNLIPQHPHPPMLPREWLEEMRAIRGEVAALRRTIDAFAGVFLNSKFPYGKPTDRWARR